MTSMWWYALPLLLLPVWWHRQKKERTKVALLATARFLPLTSPEQQRVWRWLDLTLLLLRCILLAAVIAWLADLVIATRGNTVLVAPGSDRAWTEQQVVNAGMKDADVIVMPTPEVFDWIAQHEREWKPDARLLVLGNVNMPARQPHFGRQVELRSQSAPNKAALVSVAIVSERAAQWRAMFDALGGAQRFNITFAPHAQAGLIIWDRSEAPPAGLKAPLWWVGDATAFPQLKQAPSVAGLRYADSERGRLWASSAWPPVDADAARAQFELWQRVHFAPLPYAVPSQILAPSRSADTAPASGALRSLLTIALLALFALERILAHATRR